VWSYSDRNQLHIGEPIGSDGFRPYGVLSEIAVNINNRSPGSYVGIFASDRLSRPMKSGSHRGFFSWRHPQEGIAIIS